MKKNTLTILSLIYFLGHYLLYPDILEIFNYMWKIEYSPSIYKLLMSLLCVIFCSRFINFDSFGNSILSTLFFLLIIPALSVSVVVDYGINVMYILLSFLITTIVLKLTNKKKIIINSSSFNKRFFKNISVVIIFSILITLFSGIKSFNILSLLSNVYELRSENSFTGIFAYIIFWIPSVIVFWLLFFGFFISNKIKYALILLALILSIIAFLFTGLKTQLFTPFFIILIFLLAKKFKDGLYYFCFSFPMLILIIGYIFPLIPILAIIDRLIYLPALLQLRYIDFFSKNDLYLFKGSKVSSLLLFDSNYIEAPGYIIDSAFGGGGMNANTGSFGSIFGDAGIIGILFLFPLFIVFINLLLNTCTNNTIIKSLLGVYYGYTLINAPPIDIVLTHGIIIHLFILKFFTSKYNFYGTKTLT